MLDNSDLIYVILTLFSVNVIGIGGVWHAVDKVANRLDEFAQRITRCETKLNIVAGGETDG